MDQFAPLTIDHQAAASGDGRDAAEAIAARFRDIRARTEEYCRALGAEDQCLQSMPDASPPKWHRAHTTWFFEQFLLKPHLPGYVAHDEDYNYLFNSYYELIGPRHPRYARGIVTRPDVADVGAYRAHVDAAVGMLLAREELTPELASIFQLGFAHEEQHQELLLTDILHAFAQNPLAWGRRPIAVRPGWQEAAPGTPGDPQAMIDMRGGIVRIGAHADEDGLLPAFRFDNEGPVHEVLLRPYAVGAGLVTNGAWRAFIADGGYRRSTLWMADGWTRAVEEGWQAPLYWREQDDGSIVQMGLGGIAPLDDAAPVRHVSWYEADAYARWAGARLPTEQELEAAAPSLADMFGHVWQWTASPYVAYPGFRPAEGAIGEYNGKFMINQMVLRGSAHTTSPGHSRPSYRNFFHPDKRWQVTGLRLAQDR